MKKFLIAGSSLAAVAAAGSAGAVDVTLGGSIEMGIEYGVGKKVDGFMFDGSKAYQSVSLNISAAGTTDAGMKFGGKFAMSTVDEAKLNLYETKEGGPKHLAKLVNSEASAKIKGAAYNVSGGQKLSDGAIVSVKINSEWQAAKSKTTGYYGPSIGAIADGSAVCKIAGRVATEAGGDVAAGELAVARANTKGTAIGTHIDLPAGLPGAPVAGVAYLTPGMGYLPAGRLTADNAEVDEGLILTMATSEGARGLEIDLGAADTDVPDLKDADWDVFINEGDTAGFGQSGDTKEVVVEDATVYAGPFMSVKMTSSTTKMVIGAVCVTNEIEGSATKAYLDLATPALQVGAASIFVEGGFGKLMLQQGDYSGKVAAIGSAGDQATLTSTGLVAILEGTSMMGMAGYAAVDVGSVKAGSRPNYLLGTSVDLMGLTVAVEMEDEVGTTTYITKTDGEDTTSEQNKYIDNWDMGTTYTLGDMDINGVLDSAGDWALSTSAEVGGFKAAVVMEHVKKGKNKKAGLSIDTTLTTTFNGMAVSIGLDEDMDYSLSGSYSIGNSGLAISASYDSGDEGGKVSAKLSF